MDTPSDVSITFHVDKDLKHHADSLFERLGLNKISLHPSELWSNRDLQRLLGQL